MRSQWKRAGAALDVIVGILGALMILLMLYVAISSNPPVAEALRQTVMPDDIDPNAVNARYRDGVLQVSVARRETSQPRRIDIQ